MSTDVTSVGMVSEFPEPSLQGHFSTGFDGAGLRSEFGFAGVMQKPVTPAMLQETLVEALEGAN